MGKTEKILFYTLLAMVIACGIAIVVIVYKYNFDSKIYDDMHENTENLVNDCLDLEEKDIFLLEEEAEEDLAFEEDGDGEKEVYIKEKYTSEEASEYQAKKTKAAKLLAESMEEINSDYIGYIKMKDTVIDYPIVLDDGSNHYLHYDFYGNYSSAGTLFQHVDTDYPYQVCYGHHMKNGSMFAEIMNYRDESFYKEHKTFTYITKDEVRTYYIIGVYMTTDDGYQYKAIDYDNAEDKDAFISEMLDNSIYPCSKLKKNYRHILALSTCEYSKLNGRFVVLAADY